jgi:hypothetical protein
MESNLIALTLWMLLIQNETSSAKELGYAWEKYDESPGIYFENKGQATLYNTEWKTIAYVNLKQTMNQTVVLEQYIGHINRLCHELDFKNWTECNHFNSIATDKLHQVQNTVKLLLDIIDHKYSGKRVRRGVFNFIGEVSKILFGTMDDDDAKYYNEQIRYFEQNSNSITNLLKQQLYVVKSSLGAINDTLSDMEYNEAKVREGLLQVKNYIELVTSKTKRVTDVLSTKITIESHIAHVKEALNYVQRSLDIPMTV